ncbi:zf-HC5HC2H 2 domain containing protein [Trichuris trichiura]|uniref:Zf-HC5HC2H 2 domain containing protein n=1 Tax=Trichuris trichiura TaxID=36087 RepID=A0A077Z7G1_TRITR|nr:zf-HC5HC2H 2 domain containing protein [Trichuris trichiura]
MNCSSEEGDEELSEVEDEENTSSVEAIDTVSSSADGTNSVSSDISVKICLICLQGGNVVTCAACGLPVHRRCYGSNLFPQNVAQWFCDTCCSIGENSSGSNAPFCVLCPVRGGAMRVTDVGNYFHVVCAMVHKKLLDENDALCERPNLLELASQFGQNPCVLCKDSEFACCGVSVLCDSGLCKKSMHVSCAQRAGLFVHDAEPNVFYVWCYDHRDIEASKHNKRLYKEIIQHMLNFSRSDLSIKPTKKLEQTVSKNLTATMKDDVEIPATAFAEFITLDHRKKEKLCQNKMHANQALRKKRLARRSIELYIDGILFDKSIPVAFSEEFFYYYHARAEALKCTNEFNEKMENKCNAIEVRKLRVRIIRLQVACVFLGHAVLFKCKKSSFFSEKMLDW